MEMSQRRVDHNSVNEIDRDRTHNVALGRGRGGASQVVIKQKPYNQCKTQITKKMKIGTWNVRTMNRPEKLPNIQREMNKLNLDILGLCEIRWKDCGDFEDADIRMIYSGGERAERGVAIVLRGNTRSAVEEVECISDRIMWIKLKGEKLNTLIIQVYMPTSDHQDDEVEEMYDVIEEIINTHGRTGNLIVMGDWNSVIGEGRDGIEVGNYGLGRRNERGDKLVDFCRRQKLVVTNTWFENHRRRRYTWKTPGDRDRYQIDFILIRQRYRNAVKNSKVYPGADADTDHNLVAMELAIRFKFLKKHKRKKKWNVEKLKGEQKEVYAEKVNEQIQSNRNIYEGEMTSNERWVKLSKAIKNSAHENIGYQKQEPKKPWVTTDMIEKMDERRKWKNSNTEAGRRNYRRLNNELRRETDRAKEIQLDEDLKELEELEKKGRSDLMHKKVKEINRVKKGGLRSIEIEGKNGEKLKNPEDVRKRWMEHIEDLYDKENKPPDIEIEEEADVDDDEIGPELLDREIEATLKELKNGKAPGPDDIPSEFLKSLVGEAKAELKLICHLIYKNGDWPEDHTKISMIAFPKKPKTIKCSEHRTISLISHASKIVLRILAKRLKTKTDEYIGKDQFGFRSGCGTREAIGCMRMIQERVLDVDEEMFSCFIDFEKAFDRVQWPKILEILKNINVDWRDRRLIKNLYLKQTVTMHIAGEDSDPGTVGRGVRQGCSLSPILFNIYAEAMMKESLEDLEDGIKVGGELVKTVRFADDKAVVCSTKEGLQRMINEINSVAERYGMKINTSKTKVMRTARRQGPPMNMIIGNETVEEVGHFKYLGSIITQDGNCCKEIKSRIAQGKVAFERERRTLTGKLRMELKKRFVKGFVWSVALYGSETWTIKAKDKKHLEAFEMWIWRRMLKISWRDHKTNEEVLRMVGVERTLISTIRNRQKNWMGHILRGDGLLKDIIEGKFEGRRPRGRKRKSMLDDLKGGRTFLEMKRMAMDRALWRVTNP